MFTLNLIYKDGTVWHAGGFSTQESADAWVAEEKTRPYWDQATRVEIINNTPVLHPVVEDRSWHKKLKLKFW